MARDKTVTLREPVTCRDPIGNKKDFPLGETLGEMK